VVREVDDLQQVTPNGSYRILNFETHKMVSRVDFLSVIS